MVVNEYGSPTDPAVILLAPMMVSGSDLYELMSPHFSGTYYFIAPDQGGHGKAGSYKNADDEYRQLKAWLLDNGIQKIEFLFAICRRQSCASEKAMHTVGIWQRIRRSM